MGCRSVHPKRSMHAPRRSKPLRESHEIGYHPHALPVVRTIIVAPCVLLPLHEGRQARTYDAICADGDRIPTVVKDGEVAGLCAFLPPPPAATHSTCPTITSLRFATTIAHVRRGPRLVAAAVVQPPFVTAPVHLLAVPNGRSGSPQPLSHAIYAVCACSGPHRAFIYALRRTLSRRPATSWS